MVFVPAQMMVEALAIGRVGLGLALPPPSSTEADDGGRSGRGSGHRTNSNWNPSKGLTPSYSRDSRDSRSSRHSRDGSDPGVNLCPTDCSADSYNSAGSQTGDAPGGGRRWNRDGNPRYGESGGRGGRRPAFQDPQGAADAAFHQNRRSQEKREKRGGEWADHNGIDEERHYDGRGGVRSREGGTGLISPQVDSESFSLSGSSRGGGRDHATVTTAGESSCFTHKLEPYEKSFTLDQQAAAERCSEQVRLTSMRSSGAEGTAITYRAVAKAADWGRDEIARTLGGGEGQLGECKDIFRGTAEDAGYGGGLLAGRRVGPGFPPLCPPFSAVADVLSTPSGHCPVCTSRLSRLDLNAGLIPFDSLQDESDADCYSPMEGGRWDARGIACKEVPGGAPECNAVTSSTRDNAKTQLSKVIQRDDGFCVNAALLPLMGLFMGMEGGASKAPGVEGKKLDLQSVASKHSVNVKEISKMKKTAMDANGGPIREMLKSNPCHKLILPPYCKTCMMYIIPKDTEEEEREGEKLCSVHCLYFGRSSLHYDTGAQASSANYLLCCQSNFFVLFLFLRFRND